VGVTIDLYHQTLGEAEDVRLIWADRRLVPPLKLRIALP
jgi:hypothetical protein